jgi:hypothetical protein
MHFRTPLNIPPSEDKIRHSDKVVLLGSCFSDHIGNKLVESGFNANPNPLGIVYNPLSLNGLAKYLSGSTNVESEEVHEVFGVYNHPDFHSQFASESPEKYLAKVKNALVETKNFIKEAKFIFITLGSAIAYYDLSMSRIISNCHKRPAASFKKVNISIDEGTRALSSFITIIRSIQADAKFIFTVSPVRHIKDGIIENSRSKARLMCMVENTLSEHARDISYFPSYEWMIDDLRDYRYYSDDMIHPSKLAIEYIWSKFIDHYMDDETRMLSDNVLEVRKAFMHRPFNTESEAHQKFQANTIDAANSLKKQLPWVHW